ncbi:hypothetical protein [Vibrio sp. V04_P4A5T148]|uniref:hypothetical protein n=1 Tax=Vibrio sp. V04_P4A5T148 TaxID=1938659 RepID=UPI000B8ED652|nr:hypothetical protein [Vibrio sp. V04_P4A5T148]OXX34327.1 hypothetical protein B9J81_09380 [Vibrio sp. V04_P4A5T148]
MLGGRLDAEGYFADQFTAINNPTRSRNNKYVMIVYCLSSTIRTWNLPFNFNLIWLIETHLA